MKVIKCKVPPGKYCNSCDYLRDSKYNCSMDCCLFNSDDLECDDIGIIKCEKCLNSEESK